MTDLAWWKKSKKPTSDGQKKAATTTGDFFKIIFVCLSCFSLKKKT